jgi:uncharacterized protein involved in copper resistance
MKTINLVLASLALAASPAFAQATTHEHKPMCEKMMAGEECEHKCCNKDDDGNMVCKMMDHGEMDHGEMDHSKMEHSEMDHGEMDHSKMEHSEMDHSKMDHAEKEPETPTVHHHND